LDDNDKVEDKTLLCLIGTSKQDKLSFQFVAKKATNLVCLVQSDPTTLGSPCNLLEQLTNRLPNSQSISVQSYHTALPSYEENLGATPTLGTLKAAPNMYHHKRFKSRHESREQIIAKKKSRLLTMVGQSNDLDILA
jgi:hypothetical protein